MFIPRYLSAVCGTATFPRALRTLSRNTPPSRFLLTPRSSIRLGSSQSSTGESNKSLQKDNSADNEKLARKIARSPAAKISLRRVAVEAQRSKDVIRSRVQRTDGGLPKTKVRATLIYPFDSYPGNAFY